MTSRSELALVSTLLVGLLLVAKATQATTFVLMPDETLVDQSPWVIQGHVASVEPGPASVFPATDYVVEVDAVWKGRVPDTHLVVRVPGGLRADGLGFRVAGAPIFRPQERALLFLQPMADGTVHIVHLMLGAFTILETEDGPMAIRSLEGATEVALPGGSQSLREREKLRRPRHLEAFTRWIADRARGLHRSPDYFVSEDVVDPDDTLRARAEAFNLFEDPDDGLNIRWFKFDQGQVEMFFLHEDGQPGLSMQELQTAMLRALAVWNEAPGANIRYAFGGTTGATGGLTSPDGVSTFVAEDPNSNSLFGGPYSCSSGGVLAIGGPWFTLFTQPGPGGQQYHRIAEGEVVTNRNIGCFFDASPDRQAAADELLGHEVGHTLGIDHSCGDSGTGPCDTTRKAEALMRAFIHDDGRGAQLGLDDLDAARALYVIPEIFTDGFESGDISQWSASGL